LNFGAVPHLSRLKNRHQATGWRTQPAGADQCARIEADSLGHLIELIAFPSTERGKPHSMRLSTEIQLVAQFLDSASRAVL
jgi:hypothetical protein